MTLSTSSSNARSSSPNSPLATSSFKPGSTANAVQDDGGGGGHNKAHVPWHEEWLILPKLLYFFLNMVIYSVHSFGTQYFVKELGLKDYQVSFISAFSGINFLGAIMWSSLADRTGHHKFILAISSIGYGLTFCLLQLDLFRNYDQQVLKLVYTATIVTIANFIQSAMFPLLDANVMATMSNNPLFTKENFGRQRMFGSVGHTCATMIAGYLLEWIGYKGMFILLVINCVIFSILVLIGVSGKVEPGMKTGHHGHHGEKAKNTVHLKDLIPNSPTPSPPDIHKEMQSTSSTITSPVWTLMTNLNFMFFMVFVLVAGISRSVMTNYQTYFILNVLDKNASETSWTNTVRLIFELGVFFFGKQLMHLIGIYWLLILSQISGILRILGYALLNSDNKYAYAITFALETIKGLNSGLLSLSAIRIASDLAPKGCENSAQGLFSGNYSGLSMAVGGAIGGLFIYIQDEDASDKMQVMFWWVTLVTGFFTFLFTLIYGVQGNLRLPNRGKKQEKNTEEKS